MMFSFTRTLLVRAVVSLLIVPIFVFARSFTVGVESQNYLPISNGEDGNYTGYAREVLDTFAAKHGHTFIYKPMPVARLLDEFIVQKSIDFKFPDNPQWRMDIKKGTTVTYSNGIISVTEGAMVTPANLGKPITKLVTVRGFTPFPYLSLIKDKTVTLSEVNTTDAVIKMVEAGRVDAGYLGILAATYTMRETMKKPNVIVYDSSAPHTSSDFVLSTISRPEVIKQLNEFLVNEKNAISKLKFKFKITH